MDSNGFEVKKKQLSIPVLRARPCISSEINMKAVIKPHVMHCDHRESISGPEGRGSNDEVATMFQGLESATCQFCIPVADVASRKTREIASRAIQKHVGPCLLSLL
jgi:hypothetical protein